MNTLLRRTLLVGGCTLGGTALLTGLSRFVDGLAGAPPPAGVVARPAAAAPAPAAPASWADLVGRERAGAAGEDDAAPLLDPFRPRPVAPAPASAAEEERVRFLFTTADGGGRALVGDCYVERGDALLGGVVTSVDAGGVTVEREGSILRLSLEGGRSLLPAAPSPAPVAGGIP